MMKNNAPDIYDIVKDAKTVAISAHIKPDGDAIGSCLAMSRYLKNRMPSAEIKVFLEKPGVAFETVPGYESIDSLCQDQRAFDYFIMIDTVSARLGDALPIFEKAKKIINIDHHISNAAGQGDINYVVPDASASAELVYNCLEEEYIDKETAMLLYMGIAHDTGVFRYSNTSPETLSVASKLISYGFDFSTLLNNTYFEKTYAQTKAQGLTLYNSEMYLDNRVITAVVSHQFMLENNVSKNDFEGVVSQLLLTKGTNASVFMYEKEPGLFKVSLRSNTDDIDVAKVSTILGGGGHVRAAGADVKGQSKEILNKVIELIAEQLK